MFILKVGNFFLNPFNCLFFDSLILSSCLIKRVITTVVDFKKLAIIRKRRKNGKISSNTITWHRVRQKLKSNHCGGHFINQGTQPDFFIWNLNTLLSFEPEPRPFAPLCGPIYILLYDFRTVLLALFSLLLPEQYNRDTRFI